MKIGKVKMYKGSTPTCIAIYLFKSAREILGVNEVVVVRKYDKLILRRPAFDDNHVFTLHNNQFTYSMTNAYEYIGEYFIEQLNDNQDDFELIPIKELDNG